MDLAFLRECIVDSFEKIAEINKTHTEDRLIQKQLELNSKNEENFEIISRLISWKNHSELSWFNNRKVYQAHKIKKNVLFRYGNKTETRINDDLNTTIF